LAKILQAESIGEAENCAIELQKIAQWAADNEIRFNEEKLK